MIKRLVIGGCLLILFTQAVFQGIMARTDSQTTDEAVHVIAGYTYLTEGDFRFNPEHPPLVKIMSALPLLIINPQLPHNFDETWNNSEDFFYDSWRENRLLGEEFFYSSGNDTNQMIFWSRIPIVLLTLLLGLAIFLITLKHFGPIPALIATGFYALDPLIAGHGHLVTTDIAIALGILLSTYTAWRFLKEPKWKYAGWFGLAFGFALLVKHTAIIFIPILVLLALIAVLNKKDNVYSGRIIKGLLGSILIIIFMIWVGFGFQNRTLPTTTTVTQDIINTQGETESSVVSGNETANKLYTIVRPILSMLPSDYLKGITMILNHTSGGHDSFLLGENSKTGWWYYFPTLLALKLPLPTLIGLIGLLTLYIWRRPRNNLITTILITAGLFLLAAMSSKTNLGLRHVMPVMPLIFIGVGWVTSINKKAKNLMLLMLIWLSIVFTLSFPNYLGYFNELAGAKAENYSIATDSNLDWGQDLKRIKNYINEEKLVKPFIEYGWLGQNALNYYLGDNYQLLSDDPPKIGDTIIIGATAINNSEFSTVLDRCGEFVQITNGSLACVINKQ